MSSSSSSSEEEELAEIQGALPIVKFYVEEPSSSSDSVEEPATANDASSNEDSPLSASIRTPSTESLVSNSSHASEAYSFSECRLCKALCRDGFDTARDMYANNRSLELVTLPPDSPLCACPPTADEQPVHVLCLQRWTRVTADRPCSQCRHHFSAPSHLTRLDGFTEIIAGHFDWQCLTSMVLLNLWILNGFIRSAFTQWEDVEDGTDHLATLRHWLFGTASSWAPYHLLVIPLLNILLLQYFYLYYSAVKADYSLITFSYSFGRVQATQLYSALMVANFYVRREEFREGAVNYGARWDSCSYCGRALLSTAGTASYLRYVCRCSAYHLQCLQQVVNCEPTGKSSAGSGSNSSINSSRCPNCSVHFNFSSLHQLPYVLRDALLRPRSRALSLGEYLVQLQPLLTSGWPRREPSFGQYLFCTALGRLQVLKWAVVMAFFLAVEVTQLLLQQQESSTVWPVDLLATISWLMIRLVWFTGEATRLAYADYLVDFDTKQAQLQSHFVFQHV